MIYIGRADGAAILPYHSDRETAPGGLTPSDAEGSAEGAQVQPERILSLPVLALPGSDGASRQKSKRCPQRAGFRMQ